MGKVTYGGRDGGRETGREGGEEGRREGSQSKVRDDGEGAVAALHVE